MPISNDSLKQQLASIAASSVSGRGNAAGGAPPPGGPQGVFDVSNDGVTWAPVVRVRAGTGTAVTTVDGVATITAAALGATEYATKAAFRAATPPADGTVFRIVSPPGEYRYSTSSGAGWEDDDDTLLKPDSVILAANGRAFSTRASAHAATFAAARAMKGLLVSGIKHVHVESRTTFGDGAGGVYDVKDNTTPTYTDDDGETLLAASVALVLRRPGNALPHIRQWGASNSASPATNLSALNSALTKSLAIDLPPGVYEYTAPLTINAKGKVVLRGVKGQTILRPKGGRGFVVVSNCTEVLIEGVTFEGTNEAVTADADSGHGLYVTNTDRLTVTGCTIKNYGHTSKACNGIHLVSGVDYATIKDNWLEGGQDEYHGADINLTGSRKSVCSGNFCLSSTGEGINVNGSPTATSECVVTGNIVANHAVHGILGQYGSMAGAPVDTVISGNIIYNCSASGIYVNGSNSANLVISDNLIAYCGGGGPQDLSLGGGVFVGGGAVNKVTAHHNQIYYFGYNTNGTLRTPRAGDSAITECAAIRIETNALVESNTVYVSAGYAVTGSRGSWSLRNNRIYDTANHAVFVDSLADDGICLIEDNYISQPTSAKSAIYIRTEMGEYAAPPVIVRHNTLEGHDEASIAAIVYLCASKGGNILENVIRNWGWGVTLGNGEFFGTQQFLERNEFNSCAYGVTYIADLHGVARVIWGLGNRFIDVTTRIATIGGTGVYYEAVSSWYNTTTGVQCVEVTGTAAPGTLVWRQGDRVRNNNPVSAPANGWVCTVAGTPGTWVNL
jgi:Right handed beta helix region